MKSLTHFGPYIPQYNPIGLSVSFDKKKYSLSPLAEQLCIQFVKKFDLDYIKDPVFVSNFLTDLAEDLGLKTYDTTLDKWDFSDIQRYIAEVKEKTEAMTKEERKIATQLKKELRDKLKEKYGYAIVDGKRVSLLNWAVEPPCIFMSKGRNPLRGHWKRGVTKKEITLNMSSEPIGLKREEWADIVWKPKEMWTACWKSPLDSKMKYIWLSPASEIRQKREAEKFALASRLGSEMTRLEKHIENELCSPNLERRKLASAVYLMKALAIRVGDEKNELGTVGCTTLKPEHVTVKREEIILEFEGKDFVHWLRKIVPCTEETTSSIEYSDIIQIPKKDFLLLSKNLNEFIKIAGNDFIFKGIDSNKVSKFLREVVPHLSAKVFRTYMAGVVWDKVANENLKLINEKTSIPMRKYLFKMTNLAVAKKLNHKKALPKNYADRLAKKEEQLKKEQAKLEAMKDVEASKLFKQMRRVEKIACDLSLLKETTSWNLGTSLTSYIDPNKVIKFAREAGLQIEDIYTKVLREKYSWAIKEERRDNDEE